jgi:hypothetical protein
MKVNRTYGLTGIVCVVLLLHTTQLALSGRQASNIQIDNDDIAGLVSSAAGPEAGVWVIAETTDLPTKFAKIVVTDERGRYLLPDLPKANYSVWVRGYGLIDSPKVQSASGKTLDLRAVVAPSPRAAAEYYPANYWLSLVQVPAKSEFPGTGPRGNGIAESVKTQDQWLAYTKTLGCTGCHQVGTKPTRDIPAKFGSDPLKAWDVRLQSGQSGAMMSGRLDLFGRQRGLQMWADWTDRIKGGELPPAPPRPQGAERNLVLSVWDWADPKAFVHDLAATDKRTPTVNANGPVYGVQELSGDYMTILDPVKNEVRRVEVSHRNPNAPPAWPLKGPEPWVTWGEDVIWSPKAAPHTNTLDAQGRVWMTSRDGCKVYDPKSGTITTAPCPGGHHLVFSEGSDEALWFCSFAFFKPKMWEQTKDAAKAGARGEFVIDANGNGRRDPYVDAPSTQATSESAGNPAETPGVNLATNRVSGLDGSKDLRIRVQAYGVSINHVDGSVWFSTNSYPGQIVRLQPGAANSPATALAEMYVPPLKDPKKPEDGYKGSVPRGIAMDRNGVAWMAMSGSGHLASFDRRKCKVLSGPQTIDGTHCPEGWTFYPTPGPHLKGIKDSGSADAHYYNWVDDFDTSGLGRGTPFVVGSGSDALHGLDQSTGRFVTMRVPYPLGFHSRGMDGRIDDPNAGWKGRGLWAAQGGQATWHMEGGPGTNPKVVKFQLRPNPLAK